MNARETERELRRDGRRYAEAIYPFDECTIADLRDEFPNESDRDVLFAGIVASEENARCYAGSICERITALVSSLEEDDDRAEWLEDALYDAWDAGVEIGAAKVACALTTRNGNLKRIYREGNQG